MRLLLLGLTVAALAAPALAQQPAAAPGAAADATVPEVSEARVNQLIIYGDDPCPQSTNDEIIVCARLPEDDRYRIPPELRNDPNAPSNQSWANRAVELSYAGRSGIGSCSTAGPGGMIGCFDQIVQEARAERRNGEQVQWNRLIEQAREERMRRIGEEAEAEVDQQDPPPPPQ